MNAKEIVNLKLAELTPFAKHPFKPYSEERLKELAESIKTNGIMAPIIVRRVDETRFEILSGHNRVSAAEIAGISEVPAIVRDGISDDEAMLIVTETNLIQRSFADMSHSERALTLTAHYDAIKQQGRRTDIINDVENLLNPAIDTENLTASQIETRRRSDSKIAQVYGLDRNLVARYLRINQLIEPLKTRLDEGEIAFMPAVALSFIKEDEQVILVEVLTATNLRITIKNSEELKDRSNNRKLDYSAIESILKGANKKKRAPNAKRFGAITKVVDKYFTGGEKAKEIETIVDRALRFYFESAEKGE